MNPVTVKTMALFREKQLPDCCYCHIQYPVLVTPCLLAIRPLRIQSHGANSKALCLPRHSYQIHRPNEYCVKSGLHERGCIVSSDMASLFCVTSR